MAVRTWDYGATTTVWTTAANWSADTAPVANDEVVFDATSVVAPLTGMAVTDTGGVDFDLLHFKSTYTGGIGATQVPLHTSAQKIIIEGSGTYYIEIAESTAVDQIVPTVIINNSAAIVYLTGDICTAAQVCEVTNLYLIAGTIYLGNDGTGEKSLAVQYLHVSPAGGKSSGVTLAIHNDCERLKATAYAMTIYMATGTVVSDSAAALIEMNGGTFTLGTEGGGGTTDETIALLRLHKGIFTWVPESTGGAPSITAAHIFGGTFNANSTVNDNVAKIITTMHAYPGATVNLNNNVGTIDVAALYNYGALVTFDKGIKLDIDPTTVYNIP